MPFGGRRPQHHPGNVRSLHLSRWFCGTPHKMRPKDPLSCRRRASHVLSETSKLAGMLRTGTKRCLVMAEQYSARTAWLKMQLTALWLRPARMTGFEPARSAAFLRRSAARLGLARWERRCLYGRCFRRRRLRLLLFAVALLVALGHVRLLRVSRSCRTCRHGMSAVSPAEPRP